MDNWLFDVLAILPAIIIGISFHEFAHAKMAIKLGDPTPKMQGRDTVSPLSHIDPIGFLCLLLAHFGWGRPVRIDPRYFKNPLKDQMIVSLAGPVMNLIIAFVSLLILKIIGITGILTSMTETVAFAVDIILQYMVIINISLFIFNLLPLPNFDGSKILLYFVPDKWKVHMLNLERYGFIIFLVIVLTPIPQYVITPILEGILNGMQYIISVPFSIFS